MTTTVELTRFRVAPAMVEQLLAARPAMIRDFEADRTGFLGARLVRLPADEWLDIVEWRSPQDFAASREKGANLPDAETAKKFSVESIYDETPLGYHQPSRFFSDKLGEIEEWCPEARMVGAKRVWFD